MVHVRVRSHVNTITQHATHKKWYPKYILFSFVFFFSCLPFHEINAFGVSPSVVDLGSLLHNTTKTARISFGKVPSEQHTAIPLIISFSGLYSSYFDGESSIIIPADESRVNYVFNVRSGRLPNGVYESKLTALIGNGDTSDNNSKKGINAGSTIVAGVAIQVHFTVDDPEPLKPLRDNSIIPSQSLVVTPTPVIPSESIKSVKNVPLSPSISEQKNQQTISQIIKNIKDIPDVTSGNSFNPEKARSISKSISIDLDIPKAIGEVRCASNDLIKSATNDAVYYCGSDGKRYVFPNITTYDTWFQDFRAVKVLKKEELAAIELGGLVTYRPGTRMVKLELDPRVYVVAHGGRLRWVMNEAIATKLYGARWNTLIDDIPSGFWKKYTIIDSITQ